MYCGFEEGAWMGEVMSVLGGRGRGVRGGGEKGKLVSPKEEGKCHGNSNLCWVLIAKSTKAAGHG
jgi:hypothetical protein